MSPRLRKMRTYHPRRRTRGKEVHKQAIHDIKHRLNAGLGDLITLLKEGNEAQITQSQQQAKVSFLKYSAEMHQIAQKMGNKYVKAVTEYLNSLDIIIHSTSLWIDDVKIRQCYLASDKLDRELAAA